jgi:GDP-4-dehydro-6-deoxy-D-mannose reductase
MDSSKLRILVTGGNGFVGRKLVAKLASLPDQPEIIVGAFNKITSAQPAHVRNVKLDVTHLEQIRSVIRAEEPSHVVHLAAVSGTIIAQRNVELAWKVNAEGAFNVALAVFEGGARTRLLHCSTAEVYGKSFQKSEPVDETAPVEPINVYGASKAASDLMIGELCNLGLRAVRLRPFNHTGAGQTTDFVVPAFATQIARIERGLQEPIIRVGDLTTRRDFMDVDDVVSAYVAVIRRFDKLPPRCVLNLASGRAIAIKAILDMLLSYSNVNIEIRLDPARVRTNDTPVAVGNAQLACRLLGWAPGADFRDTLRSVLDHCRTRFDHEAP